MYFSQQNQMDKSPKIPRVKQSFLKVSAKSNSHANSKDKFIRSLTFHDVDYILVRIGDETVITIDRPFYESSKKTTLTIRLLVYLKLDMTL